MSDLEQIFILANGTQLEIHNTDNINHQDLDRVSSRSRSIINIYYFYRKKRQFCLQSFSQSMTLICRKIFGTKQATSSNFLKLYMQYFLYE